MPTDDIHNATRAKLCRNGMKGKSESDQKSLALFNVPSHLVCGICHGKMKILKFNVLFDVQIIEVG